MYALTLPNCILSSTSKRVAEMLFALGEDRGYGLLFRSAFVFTPLITNQNDAIMKTFYSSIDNNEGNSSNGRDVFHLGIHLRHTNTRDVNGTDNGEYNCIKRVLETANPTNKTCVILVASDRVNALERMKRNTEEFGCKFVTSNHSKVIFPMLFLIYLFLAYSMPSI